METTDPKEKIKEWIEEAVQLRYGIEIASYTDLVGPWQVVEQLALIRQTLDRLEELLINSVRARASLKRGHERLKNEVQVEWDKRLIDQNPSKRAAFTQEFITGKEKFADANLATLELQRKERLSAELCSFADEAVDVIRQLHRGLDSTRQDLLAQVKAMQVESHLER